MAQTAVTGFSEPFQDTRPFYRGTYFRLVGRTATGSGVGGAVVVSGSAQIRLGQFTDFSFPFRNGGRFYLGVRAVLDRTATGSGVGSDAAVALVLRQRQGTGGGTGGATAVAITVAIRTASGSGVGSATVTGLHVAPRTASGNGVGSDTTVGQITPVRTAQGSGIGDSVVTFIRVPIRTATGSGVGSGNGVDLLVAIRTASGSGTGSATALGGILYIRSAEGSGIGTQTADWDKSHIFRVPFTTIYSQGVYRGEGTANRLQSYNRHGVRTLNLYHLTDDSYTTVEQRDQSLVLRLWHGGHDHFLSDDEVTELTAAGFGASIT